MLLLAMAVPLVAAVFHWLRLRAGRRLDAFMSAQMRARFVPKAANATLQSAMAFLGLMLVFVAAARPQWGREDVTTTSRGKNVLIAMDVSRSMLATDVHPNRLERAKVDVMDLISDLRGDRAGLLAFRGKANVICPLTTDRAFLRQALDGISVDSAPRGETDIADAMTKALDALSHFPEENNAIILISDGEDLAGRAVATAKTCGERGIPVFTVGLGDASGAEVPSEDGAGTMKFNGQKVVSKMTEGTLREIAQASGGAYVPLATSGTASTTLGAIYRQHLSRIATREMEETFENRLIERYAYFLVAGLLLLLAAASMSKGRLASSIRRNGGLGRATALFAFVLSAMAINAAAGDSPSRARDLAREAQREYKRGDFADSAAKYEEALKSGADQDDAVRYRVNAGISYYEAGDLETAAKTLNPVISKAEFPVAAEAYGAAMFKQAYGGEGATNEEVKAESLSRAADGFQRALRASPGDERLTRNLALALSNLPAVRDAAHLRKIMEKYGKRNPAELADIVLKGERRTLSGAEAACTNLDAQARIDAMEELASVEREGADAMLALRALIAESGALTNEEQKAQVLTRLDEIRSCIASTADMLDGALDDSYTASVANEDAVAGLWKSFAMPPALLDEAILSQTNAVANPSRNRFAARDDVADAHALMKCFEQRFPQWAEEYMKQAEQRKAAEAAQRQASTNAVEEAGADAEPEFTQETVDRIMEMLKDLLWIQEDILKGNDRDQRTSGSAEAVSTMLKIRELMPKDKNQGNGEGGQGQQGQSGGQDEQERNQDENQQQEQQQAPQDEQQQNQPEEQKAQESDEKEPPPDVQEALRRALEREKEHEADKRRRMKNYPMPPGTRDW